MQVPYNMQVPHEEVHERVSSILKDYGFCPTEEGISIGNLYFLTLLLHCFNDSKFVFKYLFSFTFFWRCHYVDVLSKKESPYKHGMQTFVLIKIYHSDFENNPKLFFMENRECGCN
jgi:hypothetical protein